MDLRAAYDARARNRALVEASQLCGCFSCFALFAPSEVTGWADADEDWATCPHCGMDTVLPSTAGFPVTVGFLKELNAWWKAAGRAKPGDPAP